MIRNCVPLIICALALIGAGASGGCLQPLDTASGSMPIDPNAGPTIVDFDTPDIELTSGGDHVATACEATTIQTRAILETHCAVCHAAPQNHGNFDAVLDFSRLVSELSKTTTDPQSGMFVRLLIPGDADDSRLYIRMTRDEMPPAGITPRPTIADFSLLKQWISVCLGDSGEIKGGQP